MFSALKGALEARSQYSYKRLEEEPCEEDERKKEDKRKKEDEKEEKKKEEEKKDAYANVYEKQ